MEPQINYGSSFQSPTGQSKVYGRSRGGKGCFAVIGTIVLLVVVVIVGIVFAYPALTPNKIRGDFLDMVIVPQKDGSSNLWILTDGSFNFIQTTKSPGSYSTGRKCFFCKTWTYVYDPVGGKIIKKTKTEQQDIITQIDMAYYKGKVWVLTHEYGNNEPKVEAYDAQTSELVMDTKAFMDKYPELRAGLSGITYTEKENTMTLKTKDGREQLTYSFENDKLYNNFTAFYEDKVISDEPSSIVVLSPESGSSSGPRKKLFKVSGPKGMLFQNKTSLESYANDEKQLSFFAKGASSQPLGDRIYLEGIIYHQDEDCTLLIHLDQLGKKSNRMLTCIDNKAGKEKWTVQQDDLFKHMKIDENSDAFSSLFFTKDKIKIRREGNIVVLELKGDGIMGFDYNTGKKLWTLDI